MFDKRTYRSGGDDAYVLRSMLVALAVTGASFTLMMAPTVSYAETGAVRFRVASGKDEGTLRYRGRYDLLSGGGI